MSPKKIKQSSLNYSVILLLLISVILTSQTYAQTIPKLFAPSAFQGSSGPLTDIFGADFDNDGHIDLVATYFWDPDIVLFFNDGSGGVAEIINLNPTVEVADLLEGIEGADLDNDGDIDLVTATQNGFFG